MIKQIQELVMRLLLITAVFKSNQGEADVYEGGSYLNSQIKQVSRHGLLTRCRAPLHIVISFLVLS
jgi:hypothetical protein